VHGHFPRAIPRGPPIETFVRRPFDGSLDPRVIGSTETFEAFGVVIGSTIIVARGAYEWSRAWERACEHVAGDPVLTVLLKDRVGRH
jgi:hypothetical protein